MIVAPLRLLTRAALAAVLSAPGLPAQTPAGRTVPGLPAADSLAAAEFAKDSIASITVGVIAGGELVWTRSYGFADMNARRPADRRTVYRIGSITKPFTAVMLLQLVEAGRLRLSDPVKRYFPEIRSVPGLPPGAAPITFLQLATMTSGLAREPRQEGPFWSGPVSRWEATLISALPHTRYESFPGTRFSYSNIGYAILGAALGRVAGQPYLRWQRERILEPLGMGRTRFEVDTTIAADLAQGYAVGEDGKTDAETPAREAREGRGYKVPNGALFTTVDDLARFVALELGRGPEGVLPRTRLDSAFAGIVASSAHLAVGYGLGFVVERRGDFTAMGHEGGVAGYTASMYFDRAAQLGVVAFRNASGGKASVPRLAGEILRRLVDEAHRAGAARGR